MEIAEIRDKSLVEYLAGLGIKPSRETGKGFQYISPFRDENLESFWVFRDNHWHDFGTGSGGSIIDFVMELKSVGVGEAIKILKNGSAVDLPEHEKKIITRKPGVEVVSVNEITSEDILSYTDTRCIPRELVKKYCKAVSFRFPLGKRPGRIYTSCGFKTDDGGFEIRSSFFKISISPKNISSFSGAPDKLNVFEGFMDFLSALTYFKKDKFEEKTTVLNSLSYINSLVPVLRDAPVVNLYIDSGAAADKAIQNLRDEGVSFFDKRDLFKGAEDFNAFLVNCKK